MKVSKTHAVIAYAVGTVLMVFGWLGGQVQGDAAEGHPGTAGIIAAFAVALALLAPAAVSLWRARRGVRVLLLAVVGLQALICLYVVAAEFVL
jgi:uncharacterized membrane protein (UPF0136 family)